MGSGVLCFLSFKFKYVTYLQVESGETILVNLVVDDMAIMKYLKFDGKNVLEQLILEKKSRNQI